MAAYREELVAAMQALIDAHVRGRESMERADVLLRFGIEQLEAGADVMETLARAPRASEREATQAAFKRIIDGRHTLRLEILTVCLDLGMKPGEIAEVWGISRQRVTKYIRELETKQATERSEPADMVKSPVSAVASSASIR